MILAGDIGGTSTRLAAFTVAHGRLQTLVDQTYPSREHAGLEEIVEQFVGAHSVSAAHACFGIAGPVQDGIVRTPNLPWIIQDSALARKLGLQAVALINDLEANAYGIAALDTRDFVVLNPGSGAARGNAAVIAAGTGLGEAGLYRDGSRHRPFACEGGHADFAPRNDLEIELLRWLLAKFERVSCERVISGPGLKSIYDFLRDTGRGTETTTVVEAMRSQDASAAISQAALDGACPLCVQALDMFVSLYGAEAGNVALKFLATGGVYVGGGIAPKIVARLRNGEFMRAFAAKGRMRGLLESMPVRVIMNPNTALLGAARFAALQANLME